MNKRQYRKAKRRIRRLSERWIRPLGLMWWTVRLHHYKSRAKYAKATAGDPECSAATCRCDWRYRSADIYFNAPAWLEMSEADAEHNFVHELCHIFLGELRGCGDDVAAHEERVCQTLADAFLWVRSWDTTQTKKDNA